jgi:hypothetical protein
MPHRSKGLPVRSIPDLGMNGGGVTLPALAGAQQGNGPAYHPASVAGLQMTGAGARPIIVSSSTSSPFSSPASSARGNPRSARKPPGGAVLKGLEQPASNMATPPRSAVTSAALTQYSLSSSQKQSSVMFNPSPPVQPSPHQAEGRVHAQLQRKKPTKASFDTPINAPAQQQQQQQTALNGRHADLQRRANQDAVQQTQQKRGSGGSIGTEAAAKASSLSSAFSSHLDSEDSRYSSSSLLPSSSSRALLPDDIPVTVTGEEERTPVPSRTLYAAPPASLFALVATPDASSTRGEKSEFHLDTKNSFVHIHSSTSDDGTASAALSSTNALTPSHSGLSPSPLDRNRAAHHSLSSTPLPFDDFLPKSPSPTLSSYNGVSGRALKRRTNLGTISSLGLGSPDEEDEGGEAEEVLLSPARSVTNTSFRAGEPEPEEVEGEAQSAVMTPSIQAEESGHTTPKLGSGEHTEIPPAEIVDAVSAAASAPPAPIVLNVTLKIAAPASTDVAATSSHPAPGPSAPLDLHSFLLASILPLLSPEEREKLGTLSQATPATVASVHIAADEAVPSSSSPVDGAHTEPSTSAPSMAARTARAKSLFIPKARSDSPGSKEAQTAKSARADSAVEGQAVSFATSPTSSSTSHASSVARRSARFLLGGAPHANLAAQLTKKRVSFMSKSLHSLAADEEDALTHDLLTNGRDAPPLSSDPSALQASLDHDVLLSTEDDFGFPSIDALVSPTGSPEITTKPFLPRARTSSSLSPTSGSPSGRSTAVNEGSPRAGERGVGSAGSNPPPAAGGQGEDTEVVAINHATLLLERLKVEPTHVAGEEQAKDVAVIYDKILSHLLRLKKMITRRHFKSRETLQRKLNTITDDNQVVDWISAEFLAENGRAQATQQQPGNTLSTNHLSAGHLRRATVGSPMTALLSPLRRSSDSKPRGSFSRRAAQLSVEEESGTGTADASKAPTPPSEPSEADVAIPSSKRSSLDSSLQKLVPAFTIVPPASNSTSNVTASWTSPFVYPLSPELSAAISARAIPRLDEIVSLMVGRELEDLLEQSMSAWNFDVFELNKLSDFHPVLTLGMHVFQTHPSLSVFVEENAIDLGKVFNFLIEVERGYDWRNPYHNAIHSADVLQNMLIFLSSDLFSSLLTPLDVLSAVFSALIHDAFHLGLTNNYLLQTEHPLCQAFNDQSLLENQSLSEAFRILRKPDCNFLSSLSKADYALFRSSVISMVLHTDMKNHISQVNSFEQTVMRHRNAGTWFSTASDRKILLDFSLHIADLGNPAKPLMIALQHTNLIGLEFYAQGDLERSRGWPCSPMMDRNKPTVDMQQFAFINIVVLPLMTQFAEILTCGKLADPIQNLVTNRAYYSNRMQVAKLVQSQANLLKGGVHMLKPVAQRGEKEPQKADCAEEEKAQVEGATVEPSDEQTEAKAEEQVVEKTEQQAEEPAEEASQTVDDSQPNESVSTSDPPSPPPAAAVAEPRTPVDPEEEAENATYLATENEADEEGVKAEVQPEEESTVEAKAEDEVAPDEEVGDDDAPAAEPDADTEAAQDESPAKDESLSAEDQAHLADAEEPQRHDSPDSTDGGVSVADDPPTEAEADAEAGPTEEPSAVAAEELSAFASDAGPIDAQSDDEEAADDEEAEPALEQDEASDSAAEAEVDADAENGDEEAQQFIASQQ